MSEEEYIVEEVIDKRKVNGVVEYLIKWEGYEKTESTWEPIENLKNIINLLKDFEEKERDKKNKYKKKETKGIFFLKSAVNGSAETSKTESHSVLSDISGLTPDKISTVKDIDGALHALVSWEANSDGTEQDQCYVPCSVLADTFPKKLIHFYETKIKFVNKK
jgi:hypothetical protein